MQPQHQLDIIVHLSLRLSSTAVSYLIQSAW